MGGRRAEGLATLTPRERDVLSLMAQGRSNSDNHGVIAALRYLES
jgi:DNA-binding CsgD family transcriptional regulator